jgi:hypothetical protein
MTQFALEGTAEIARTLREAAGAKVTQSAVKIALRKSMRPVLLQARLAAPRNTGRLARAQAIGESRRLKKQRPGAENITLFINPGRSRSDTRGAYYAGIVHSREPWLTGLLEKNAPTISQNFAGELLSAIEKITARVARKSARSGT